MPSKLPVSRLISVSVTLTPAGAQSQNLSTLLILGNTAVIDTLERARTYATIEEVAGDFGTTDPEYLAAQVWFAQAPKPAQVMIGRWAQTATAGVLMGAVRSAADQSISAWNLIIDGGMDITIDGVVKSLTNLNFGAVTNLNGVATVINTALTGADIFWRANEARFVVESDTTGAASTVSFATDNADTAIASRLGLLSSSSGAYRVDGIALESALNAVTTFNDMFSQQWYALALLGGTDADYLAVAPFIEASDTKHIQTITDQDTAALSSVDTASLGYQLADVGYQRTMWQYSSGSGSQLYAGISTLARILTTDYDANNTTIDLMYKQAPLLTAENLSSTQMAALAARNGNVFVEYNNDTAIIEPGNMSDGEPIDNVTNADWFATEVMTQVYNLLYTSPTKIPQTDAGTQLIVGAIANVCAQGVRNGMIAPGRWNSAGFGSLKQGDMLTNGWYIYANPIDTQSQNDREARVSPPIQVAVKLAGSIRTVDILVNINR